MTENKSDRVTKKPNIPEKEIDKLQKQFDRFENEVKDLSDARENCSKKEEVAPPEISQKKLENSKEIYLKPTRWIADRQKFNDKFQKDWEFAKEYVRCIPTHNEMKGERIEMWTHPFGGKGAEFWEIPTEKPVWVPRYVAEQLTHCKYHRFRMEEGMVAGADNAGQYYGKMVSDTTIQRLDAHPVNTRKSIFMGEAANF